MQSNFGYNKFSALSDHKRLLVPAPELKGIVSVTALISENMTSGIAFFSWKLHLF